MRGRGGEEDLGLTPDQRLVRGGIYRIHAPEADIGTWNGERFIAISMATGHLIETAGQALACVGIVDDPNITLQAFVRVSCAYCGGNLALDEDSGQWKSLGQCSCSPPSPFQVENHALRAELEDLR